jgi:hypothetical protein
MGSTEANDFAADRLRARAAELSHHPYRRIADDDDQREANGGGPALTFAHNCSHDRSGAEDDPADQGRHSLGPREHRNQRDTARAGEQAERRYCAWAEPLATRTRRGRAASRPGSSALKA